MPLCPSSMNRITMDIVGPLLHSRSGNTFIPVVCNYAIYYPEVFALKSVDAEHVTKALVSMLSRIVIPQEILTDQAAILHLKCLPSSSRCYT